MLSSVVSVSESESDEEPNINTVNKNCEEKDVKNNLQLVFLFDTSTPNRFNSILADDRFG